MDLFDIIGPIMIGPSSSHTAGAARIGLVGRKLLGEDVARAEILLHGSFADTYRGHGTDRALIAGLLGMAVDDPDIKRSLDLARERGLAFSFAPIDLEGAHPNTVVLNLTGVLGATASIRASSVGGGAIRVDRIGDLAVSFRVAQDTVVVRHRDLPGVIAHVSGTLADHGVNIATMQVFRESLGGEAVMAIEIDGAVPPEVRQALKRIENVMDVAYVAKF